MKNIKITADIIKNNLREARKYIEMAIEHKEDCPHISEWARKMAKSHLEFNQDGHTIAKKLIDEYKASGNHSDLAPGMMAMFNVIHADLIKEEMELMAMIQSFK